MDTPEQQINNGAILRELSDIKASLAVNNNETSNIKARIGEIQSDIKEIKNDYIIRREFTDGLNSVRELVEVVSDDVTLFKKITYSICSVIGIALLGAILKLIIK